VIVTFATGDLGWYALQVNANDVAVRGGRTAWFLVTCSCPRGANEAAVAARYAARARRRRAEPSDAPASAAIPR
jgi:hydrogenase maturation factor